jgi:putative methyltransferase (TIGR04325 family)
MSHWKHLIKDWLPPAVLRTIKALRNNDIHFSGAYASWAEAQTHSTGYDAAAILTKVLDATLKVKNGEAAFERDSIVFDKIEYEWPVLTGLMWAASRNGGLSVLDFGGALGSSYFQNREFLRCLKSSSWSVVEQPHYVRAGQLHLQDETLCFYHTVAECLRKKSPNAVVVSSVLQYLEDPAGILNELLGVNADILILDRTIINSGASNRIYAQHVPASIYTASYPVQSISEKWLLDEIGKNYRLITDFESLPFPTLATIDSRFKGYIFKKNE